MMTYVPASRRKRPPTRIGLLLVPLAIAVVMAGLPAQQQRGWVERVEDGPPGVAFAAMAYDSVRHRVVLFGGQSVNFGYGGYSSSTLEWDGIVWTSRNPATVPPARIHHAMAYDPIRQRVVMVGGTGNDSQKLADTWEWDGNNWLERTPASVVGGIRNHAMAFDVKRGAVVLIGSGHFLEWDGQTWGGPGIGALISPRPDYGRSGHAMAYDSAQGRLILHGGFAGSGPTYLQDTWAWDGTWTLLSSGPLGVWGHSMIFDSGLGRALMFNGQDMYEWRDEQSAWVRRQDSVRPPSRPWDAMAYDSRRYVTVMAGGIESGTGDGMRDTWEYSAGFPPSPASYEPFGVACPGSVGTATLDAAPGQLPWASETFTLQIRDIPTSVANVPFGLLGLSATSWEGFELPRELSALGMPGCTQYTGVAFVFTLVNGGGVATWEIPIPNNPALIGLSFFTQALVFDFGVNFLGAVVSNAGAGVIGAR